MTKLHLPWPFVNMWFWAGLCKWTGFSVTYFSIPGWTQDLDLLRHPRVRGSRGHPQQGSRHQRRLLVTRSPHVWAPHWWVGTKNPFLKEIEKTSCLAFSIIVNVTAKLSWTQLLKPLFLVCGSVILHQVWNHTMVQLQFKHHDLSQSFLTELELLYCFA